MSENLHETTKKIKQSLRLAMNGIVSALQRRQGLNYKINFGVEIPRLKEIAGQYNKSEELATALWQENIRECKLLAIFLLPQESYATVADKWIAETPFTEIADHLAMNILCKLPDAAAKAMQWNCNPAGLHRYCGYLTLAHLARKGFVLTPAQEELFCKQIAEVFDTDGHSIIKQCAEKALIGYIGEEEKRSTRLLAFAAPDSNLATCIKELMQDF